MDDGIVANHELSVLPPRRRKSCYGERKIEDIERDAHIQLSARAGQLYQLRALTHVLRKASKKERGGADDEKAINEPLKPHTWLYSMLNAKSRKRQSQIFKYVTTTIICVSVMSFILSTEPAFDDAHVLFDVIEAFCSISFLIELGLRVYVVPERKKTRYKHWFYGRVRFLCTLEAMVDLLACLPWFIELFTVDGNIPTLTWIRIVRLFRLLKTEKYTKAFESVYRVVWFNRGILMVALLICVMLMVTTSTCLYYIAKFSSDMDDNSDFTSIPAALYLSVMMLTGQGGPEGSLPWFMKVLCAATAIFSVPVFVIPSSMLTWGFEAEAERMMAKDRERRMKAKACEDAGEVLVTSSSSDDDGVSDGAVSDDVWEAYERVILGDTASSAATSESARKGGAASDKDIIERLFREADADEDGMITNEEVRRVALRNFSGRSRKLQHILDRVDALFREADTDNSGTLSLEEIKMRSSPTKVADGDVKSISSALVHERMDRIERRLDGLTNRLDSLLDLLAGSGGRGEEAKRRARRKAGGSYRSLDNDE